MTAYAELLGRLERVALLDSVSSLLGWDEQVYLPNKSADLRARQHALLAELRHAALTAPELGAALAAAERVVAVEADAPSVLAGARRDYDRATRLTPEFVAEQARLNSEAYHAWARAKQADDFTAFAPYLQRQLELARREAELVGWGDRPYDYAIDKHDPGLTAAQVAALFAELRAGLVPLVRRIDAAVAVRPAPPVLTGFPVAGQAAFLREVTAALGFDYDHGRIDVSLHPFCEGPGEDIRMTTRYAADAPLDALFSSIHETGHGLYEQGLPTAPAGTVLTQAAGMAVHESQSRLWENQVARSAAFWRHFGPRLRALFPAQLACVDEAGLLAAVNAVAPTLIRVESDEVHYNLHILLRFELERRLFAGELAVRDLPAAWRALAHELLDLEPKNDREGVLQDVHWSGGSFGYFPSYCLGNMLAAQLWATARRVLPGLEEDFARGEFRRLLRWLRAEVHAHGRREELTALTLRVTGEPLNPRHLLAYLENRYA
jgi:carboxypeptidase Taq